MEVSTKTGVISIIIFLVGLVLVWQIMGAPGLEDSALDVTEEVAEEEVFEEGEEVAGEEGEPVPPVEAVVENLEIPWEVAFLPDGRMLVTERVGNLLILDNGVVQEITIPGVEHVSEGGLLGLALHPDFSSNNFLYLYMTSRVGDGLINRVVRYTFDGEDLSNPETIIEDIPGAPIHDGGRIAFGPPTSCQSGQADCYLYITTGDAAVPRLSQDLGSLAGKILRLNDDGSIPEDNPFGDEIYSYGHRNPQGITWDEEGRLWSTEHGPTARDELNLIEPGENYGWPDSVGDEVEPGTVAPALHSGSDTWAPAGASYWDGSIFFVGLRGAALYEAVLQGSEVVELKEHFKGEFGRLRALTLGSDGMFYISTSNRDGRLRGEVREVDDRVIRINPNQFR